MAAIGKKQVSILRTVRGGNWFVATTPSIQQSCLRLHSQRLLARDPKRSNRWTSNEVGDRVIEDHDADFEKHNPWKGERVADRQRRAAYAGADDR